MDLDVASLKERLWHDLRHDLSRYLPSLRDDDRLMCCMCGRLLPSRDFSIEHVLPQQALAEDPAPVRAILTKNQRTPTLLLCSKMLKLDGRLASSTGCNGWKGKHYDNAIREMVNGSAVENRKRKLTERYVVAALSLAFLAMITEYGYQIVLTSQGVLMRRQFFSPHKTLNDLPKLSGMVLIGAPLDFRRDELDHWERPFRFQLDGNTCLVTIRSWVVRVPISRNPLLPIAHHLPIAPQRYKLRPDFTAFFD